jgi:hypothetical protein
MAVFPGFYHNEAEKHFPDSLVMRRRAFTFIFVIIQPEA